MRAARRSARSRLPAACAWSTHAVVASGVAMRARTPLLMAWGQWLPARLARTITITCSSGGR